MVTLQPKNLRWIQGATDDPMDLCAHGDVHFCIWNDVLLDTDGKDLTVSAAALYLLRTLTASHTKASPVGEQLFPCCGFNMWDIPGQDDVVVCGCGNGEDFEVLHEVNRTGVVIRKTDGGAWRLGWPEWQDAVFAFADQVSGFYVACSPKRPSKEDAPGFRKFKVEWERRRGMKFGRK